MNMRSKQLLGIAVLGLGLIFQFSAWSDIPGVKLLVYLTVFSAAVLIFRDEPRFRAALQQEWLERKKRGLLLTGLCLVVGSFAWLVTAIVLDIATIDTVILVFVLFFGSGTLLAGLAFYTWLVRALLGRE